MLLILVTAPVFSQTHAQKIDRLLSQYVQLKKFNGSVLVVDTGEIIHKKGYGNANFEWDIQNTADNFKRLNN